MKNTRFIVLFAALGALLIAGVAVFLVVSSNTNAPVIEANTSEESSGSSALPFIIIPVVLVIVGLSLLPFLRMLFPPVIKDGVKAEATVLKVWDTGVTINNNPRVGLLLEVRPEAGEPFQVELRKLISRLDASLVRPGAKADVIYDPVNPKRIEVRSFLAEAGTAESGSVEARLAELKSLREKDLITEEEYQVKKAEILKEV